MKYEFEYVWVTPTYTKTPAIEKIALIDGPSRIYLNTKGIVELDTTETNIDKIIEHLTALREEMKIVQSLNSPFYC